MNTDIKQAMHVEAGKSCLLYTSKLDYKSPANRLCQEKQGRLDVEIANLKLGATINLVVLYLYITKKNLLLRKFYGNAKKTI